MKQIYGMNTTHNETNNMHQRKLAAWSSVEMHRINCGFACLRTVNVRARVFALKEAMKHSTMHNICASFIYIYYPAYAPAIDVLSFQKRHDMMHNIFSLFRADNVQCPLSRLPARHVFLLFYF